jgi:hypothetical protein
MTHDSAKENRRVEQLAASRLDREVLSRNDPDDAPECAHEAAPACRRS